MERLSGISSRCLNGRWKTGRDARSTMAKLTAAAATWSTGSAR